MRPDFNKATIDTLAKRASYLCSNPDCRVMTVGPNEIPEKATIIGEAAHIYGARPNSKRYSVKMTDIGRAEITNGIWLCRNCHKMIDSDDVKYSISVLYKWREVHENYVSSQLGNISDRLLLEEHKVKTEAFTGYPEVIKRIIIDEPLGWEWRLAAELMRYLNAPGFKRLEQLKQKLYVKSLNRLYLDELPDWVDLKSTELANLATALEKVLQQLTNSFGEPGVNGEIGDIHQNCLLISELIKEAATFEESVAFAKVDKEGERLVNLFKGIISKNMFKIQELPESLDHVVELASSVAENGTDEPIEVKKSLVMEIPDGWAKNVNKELKKIQRLL